MSVSESSTPTLVDNLPFHIKEGESKLLECQLPNSFPHSEIVWQFSVWQGNVSETTEWKTIENVKNFTSSYILVC